MKKASNIMYLIAIIYGFIALAAFLIIAILGFANVIPPEAIAEVQKTYGFTDPSTIWVTFIVQAVIELCGAAIVLGGKRQVNAHNGRIGLQILCIVIGAIAGNVFLILGGIFGIISIKSN